MRRLMLLPLLMMTSVAATSRAATIEPGVPQLFVDDAFIESSQSLHRTLHQPRKDDDGNTPVIALAEAFATSPGTLEANGTIVFDPKLKRYVMFALAFRPTLQAWNRTQLYRFTSTDGLTWVKGDDDASAEPVFPRGPDDLLDAASGARAAFIDLFSCYYDAADATHPYKGWLWFHDWGEQRDGVHFMRSQDGKTWERVRQVLQNTSRQFPHGGTTLHGPSDVTTIHHDTQNNRFLASIKFYAKQPVGPDNHLRSRAFLFVDKPDQPVDIERLDHVALIPAAKDANGDQPHDEYYGSTAWRYGPLWLGELRVWHGGGDYPYSAAGCAFGKLVVSRDGLHWSKLPFTNDAGVAEVVIPNGREGGTDGRNDGGYMTLFSQGPLRIGDELIWYYGSSSWGKKHAHGKRVTGGGIFRARLRPDGFVSVDGGSVTTKAFALGGASELTINASGAVHVDVMGDGGESVATHVTSGDSLRHPVKFDGRSLGQVANTKPVRLRFRIAEKGGRLYSFTVR
jgi:hypothetical protein